jgi:hypothetical protein
LQPFGPRYSPRWSASNNVSQRISYHRHSLLEIYAMLG